MFRSNLKEKFNIFSFLFKQGIIEDSFAKNTSISIRHLSLDAFARVWKYVQNAEIFLFVPRSI